MHAVGADHGIGVGSRTIGERQPDAVSSFIQSGQLVAEFHAFVGHGAGKRRMQIAAMREQIGRAELRLRALAEDHVELDVAALPVAVIPGARIERPAAHPLLEAELAQHLHRVAADLDAGAEPRELLRLLVDRDRGADPAQRGGGREPAHAGADDRDVEWFGHSSPAPVSYLCRPESGACQRGPRLFRFQRIEKRAYGRPVLARPYQREIIVLFGERNETQPGRMRDRRNRHAPVGAMLGDGGSHRIMRARLIPVAVRPVVAK